MRSLLWMHSEGFRKRNYCKDNTYAFNCQTANFGKFCISVQYMRIFFGAHKEPSPLYHIREC